MKGIVSVLLFSVLIICGIWLHIQGILISFFNGNSSLHHIAYELHMNPFIRYGIISIYFLSIIFYLFEYKKGMKKLRTSLLIISSLLVIPIYTHIVINEYKMETEPVSNPIFEDVDQLLDYAVIEDFSYDNQSKTVHLKLNYGTDKNDILVEYFKNGGSLTDAKERSIKRSLHYDMSYIIHNVWSKTHRPKNIIFDVKWGKDVLLTLTAKKSERFLSYYDNKESDEFNSIYDHIDVAKENGNYVIKLRSNNGHWINVAP
ncbi:hypothetical protein ACLIA0_04570 [Bacillaceae bacterium W0354]